MSKNICSKCWRIVYQPEEKHAFGKVWHSFCFSCCICCKLLDCTNVQISKEELFCVECLNKPPSSENGEIEDVYNCSESGIRSTSTSHDIESKSQAPVYPCTIPVPHAVSAWYNRQHPRALSQGKRKPQIYCVSSCESCLSSIREERTSKTFSASPVPTRTSHQSSLKKRQTRYEEDLKPKGLVKFEDGTKDQNFENFEVAYIKDPLTETRRFCPSSSNCDQDCPMKQKKLEISKEPDDYNCKFGFPKLEKKSLINKESRVSSANGVMNVNNICSSTCSSPSAHQSTKSEEKIKFGGGLDCRRCGRKVYHAEMFTVSGAVYHNICFCCLDCRKPLEVMTIYENQGDIYCKLCYIRNFGPIGYGYGMGAGVLQTPTP